MLQACSIDSSPMLHQANVYNNRKMRSRQPTGNHNESKLSGWSIKSGSNKELHETLLVLQPGKKGAKKQMLKAVNANQTLKLQPKLKVVRGASSTLGDSYTVSNAVKVRHRRVD